MIAQNQNSSTNIKLLFSNNRNSVLIPKRVITEKKKQLKLIAAIHNMRKGIFSA